MAFTMHSHSGQFCPGHAKDALEDIVRYAIAVGYKTIGLTEHMPRYALEDLYPEEMDDPEASLAALPPRHEAYIQEARRLQEKYAAEIHILIAFEGEFIRPEYAARVASLVAAAGPYLDYFIGSLHHVRGVPLDFDRAFYEKARDACVLATPLEGPHAGKEAEEVLYERYYDEQYEMLTALKPRVVGHFDLVRLLSEDPNRDVRKWKGVWERIVRNLKVAVEGGMWLECNTSGLRKGLDEPYPCRIIAEEYISMGGKFTFSDDSHGIAQVATNYRRGVDYLATLGVTDVWTFERKPHPGIEAGKSSALTEKSVPLSVFQETFREQ